MADNYDSSEIKILKGLEAILKRPGMYIGNTDDGTGLHQMLWEVVSNSLDLFMANQCTEITVILHSDNSVEVIDNGKGIPLDDREGKTFLERVMTELHCTATYDGHAPHTHVGGPYGIGLVVVNALSSYVEVNIFSKGMHYRQEFFNTQAKPVKKVGPSNKSGTSIRFSPNTEKFSNVLMYDEDLIMSRLKELSFLNKKIIINFIGRNLNKETYLYEQGLVTYLEQFEQVNSKIITVSDEYKGIKVDAAFAWSDHQGDMQSFANNLNTKEGGMHVNGLVTGLAKAIKDNSVGTLSSKDLEATIVKNLVAVIHVNIADPRYGAPTKDRLINEAALEAVKNIVYKASNNEFSNDAKLLETFS